MRFTPATGTNADRMAGCAPQLGCAASNLALGHVCVAKVNVSKPDRNVRLLSMSMPARIDPGWKQRATKAKNGLVGTFMPQVEDLDGVEPSTTRTAAERSEPLSYRSVRMRRFSGAI